MEAPPSRGKMRRHGQYFAKPIPVVNERLLRGSGVCEDPEAEAQLQATRSLSEPKSSNHPELHLVSLWQFF